MTGSPEKIPKWRKEYNNQQALQIDGQVEAIRSGKPGRVPGEMGRRDIRVLRGIMEAAESGEAVDFGEFQYGT